MKQHVPPMVLTLLALTFAAGSLQGQQATRDVELVWVDRAGQVEPVGAELRAYGWPRISPDGTRVAIDARDADDNTDVWIYDLARRTLVRLTFDEAPDGHPLWTPDGSRVVFESGRDGGGLFSKAADGTGEVEQLLENSDRPFPGAWSADGRLLIDAGPAAGSDSGTIYAVEGDNAMAPVFVTGSLEYAPAISPDGRWMAYASNESGGSEIHVRPFPNVDEGMWQVSTDHGFFPVWSPDGRELLFLSRMRGGELMVARVETEPTFNASRPESVFRTTDFVGGPRRGYDLAPDGDRFLSTSPPN